jgi:hypothetical protein
MKNKIFSICMMLMALIVISACQDDGHELGAVLSKDEIDIDVDQPLQIDPGGNTVILKNNTPGTVSMWDYGTGRSTRAQDTVRFAFKGEYVIKFSAVTAGGVVELDPITIQVTEDNFNYVTHPWWTLLSGGVGEEKTWLLDLDADGVSKYFSGPVYFSSDNYDKNTDCILTGACWVWEADWKGNPWIGDQGDYGTMTFNLKGGPFVTVDHKLTGSQTVENGSYFLDTNTGMLTMTDAQPLQNGFAANDIGDWTNLKVISITENSLQLAAKHKSKAEYMVFNYISKEYSDNWVPAEPEGDPNFDHGDQKEILTIATSKTWKLDLEVPYNWASLSGEMLNAWNSRADIVATGWAPYGDADVTNIDNASISFGNDGSVIVTQDNGTTASGTFAIDEDTNIVTFTDVTPSINIASWVTATTTAENQWKIVKVERDDLTDQAIGIWFGSRATDKDEYMVFHFVLR